MSTRCAQRVAGAGGTRSGARARRLGACAGSRRGAGPVTDRLGSTRSSPTGCRWCRTLSATSSRSRTTGCSISASRSGASSRWWGGRAADPAGNRRAHADGQDDRQPRRQTADRAPAARARGQCRRRPFASAQLRPTPARGSMPMLCWRRARSKRRCSPISPAGSRGMMRALDRLEAAAARLEGAALRLMYLVTYVTDASRENSA